MSKILNKHTGRMVKPSTTTGRSVIYEQYGGAVPPKAVSPKASLILKTIQDSKQEDEISWSKTDQSATSGNFDTYMVINNGNGSYDVCSPGEYNCPHEDTDFDYVSTFVNDMEGFGEFKGYDNIYVNETIHVKI